MQQLHYAGCWSLGLLGRIACIPILMGCDSPGGGGTPWSLWAGPQFGGLSVLGATIDRVLCRLD